MKSYTDIEQSRKLAEILPLESAYMYHFIDNIDKVNKVGFVYRKITADYYSKTKLEYIPCWSLVALLKLIPNFNMFKRTIECRIETTNHLVDKACEPIDAAFEMVCWLKEHNKI